MAGRALEEWRNDRGEVIEREREESEENITANFLIHVESSVTAMAALCSVLLFIYFLFGTETAFFIFAPLNFEHSILTSHLSIFFT